MKRSNKKQELRTNTLMMIFNISLITWCICLIHYGLVSRNGWVYIFLIINSISFYYYINKNIDLVRK